MSATAPVNIHASLVAVGDRGVLIRGPARSGKSSLALCLLRTARREGIDARLVADDRVDLSRDGDGVVGAAPRPLEGLLEISGAGLVALPFAPRAAIALVVDLAAAPERLPERATCALLGAAIQHIGLPARAASLGAEVVLLLLEPTTRRLDLEASP